MVEPKITLTATAPITGDLPLADGGMTLSLADPGSLTLIAPFNGQAVAVSQALNDATGLALPETGRMEQGERAYVQWFGRGQTLLAGGGAPDLPGAAITDQTDGWVTLDLTGPNVAQVMARLVPVDLRDAAAPVGTALRTDLHGMMVAISCPAPDHIRIMGFRSMAKTLTHAIGDAMAHVAALT
ncbi:sarcosine oxidase subunit gamma [Pseudooceanicola sp. MF1-13]|uniref:sarcosine oxidase subunit gamma n=1 Tax=Pseudooceanicola sp. MF1-13 TaxID=3379095 RepID=UPI0038926C37